jgi:signal transduction histidine kinase
MCIRDRINDVLDLSKIESGRMEWHVTTCDLRDVLRDAVAASKGLFAEKAVEPEMVLGAPVATVECDRDRVMQVVINLLSNAFRFVPDDGGRIRVSLTQGGEDWLVRVEDNGPGVPPAMRETVFEKFRQIADTLKARPQGTGLGLTICRQIVERFGGRIWVEEASLGGAAFCFTLPVAAAQTRAQAAE